LDRPDRQAEMHFRPRALEQRLDIRIASADDSAPATAPEPEHPVVVEEGERVTGGEVERGARAARPERRGQGNEEVVAELRRVAVGDDVRAERLHLRLLDRPARLAQKANDLTDEPGRRVTERPATRVLELVPGAAHREG